ncbi:hypothetical protein EI94DRAFT_1741075, partial [Lactarius quietus]
TLLPPHNVRDSPTIAYHPQELPPWSMPRHPCKCETIHPLVPFTNHHFLSQTIVDLSHIRIPQVVPPYKPNEGECPSVQATIC